MSAQDTLNALIAGAAREPLDPVPGRALSDFLAENSVWWIAGNFGGTFSWDDAWITRSPTWVYDLAPKSGFGRPRQQFRQAVRHLQAFGAAAGCPVREVDVGLAVIGGD